MGILPAKIRRMRGRTIVMKTALAVALSACGDDRSIDGYDPYGPGGSLYDAGAVLDSASAAGVEADAGPSGPQMRAARVMYTNPVFAKDCPDPGVIRVDTNPITFYMVCTGGRFPFRKSFDLSTWEGTFIALLPSNGVAPWANNGSRNWAPELHGGAGQFLAYYTASNKADKLSIGVLSAPAIGGPWKDLGRTLVEDDQNIGVIDAHQFQDDDGKRYLFWKRDSNQIGQKVSMYVQELSADGLSFAAGSSRTLIANNNPASWEGGVIEAPWVYKRGGYYYLFYSGNVFDSRYRTGVARAQKLLGPYIKKGDPILVNSATWVGPGHGSVIGTRGGDYFVYHAWRNAGDGTHDAAKGRNVLLDRIEWVNDWPVINGGKPSSTPQLGP